MSNFFIQINIILNRIFAILGLRRKDDRWGIVYDSVSKQPLDPVIVKLINAVTGRVVQSCVTDLAGRFNFLAYPGKFKILVKKSNYKFPSEISAGDQDEVFKNLYHGEFFELAGDSDVIDFNIPMDPERRDWNQKAKTFVAPFHPYAENFFYGLVALLFWVALIFDVATLYALPTQFGYEVLGFYFFCLVLSWAVPTPRFWGRVTHKDGQSAAGLLVEVSYPGMSTMILAKAEVLEDGKFFLRLLPGKYELRIKQLPKEAPPELLLNKKIRVGYEQVINRNFVV